MTERCSSGLPADHLAKERANGYSEKDGQVVLTMSRYDYAVLRRILGNALAEESERGAESTKEFLNRLNQGNPNYTPYKVGENSGG